MYLYPRGWILCALVLIPMVVGCGSLLSTRHKPTIALAGIQVQEIKSFETVFVLELRVFNRSEAPLEIKGLDCDVAFNGKHFATGVASAQKTIAPYATDTVTVEVYSSVLKIFSSLMALVQKSSKLDMTEELIYEVRGNLRLGGEPVLAQRLPFKSQGVISLGELSGNMQ
jgi:LEA14-like dessication related protein